MALPDKNRLKKKKDFDLVFKKGNAVKGNFFFVKYLNRTDLVSRVGFMVPAKIIHRAVDRNKVRRLLSEMVQAKIRDFKRGYDVVVMVKAPGTEDGFRDNLDRFFRIAL